MSEYEAQMQVSGDQDEPMFVGINSDYDYVLRMVKRIHKLYNENRDKSFEELDDLVQKDDEINDFSQSHTSIYLVITKTKDPKRFSKMYSLIDLKRKIQNGEADIGKAMQFIDHLDFSFDDI